MKLIARFPTSTRSGTCRTLRRLPRAVAGFDRVEWLVIDDGSTDRTLAVAREGGVDHWSA